MGEENIMQPAPGGRGFDIKKGKLDVKKNMNNYHYYSGSSFRLQKYNRIS
jgi:hypothetical protein